MPALPEQQKGTNTKTSSGYLIYGFPAKGLTRNVRSGGGEWITAYKAEQKRHLKAVMVPPKSLQNEMSKVLFPPTNTREDSSLSTYVLSKHFLMKHCHVDHPSQLYVADVGGYYLTDCAATGLEEFDNLTSINASDNHLPLEAFAVFLSLQWLELSLNSITDVFLGSGECEFICLRHLDLSFNNLSEAGLATLGSLQALQELRLTGNNLISLPSEMTRAFMVASSEKVVMSYPVLHSLWLDDNKLCEDSVFAVLAGLRRLKYLNLNDNELCNIPRLKLMSIASHKLPGDPLPPINDGTSRVSPTTVLEPLVISTSPRRELDGAAVGKSGAGIKSLSRIPWSCSYTSGPGLTGDTPRYPIVQYDYSDISAPCVDSATGRHSRTRRSQSKSDLSHKQPGSTDLVVRPHKQSDSVPIPGNGADLVPFPELEILSLCNNLVSSAEGLVACESWPTLREIIICDNPLTRTTKGLHPLLQEVLVHQGIDVVRMQAKPQKYSTVIREKAKDFIKVSCAPPPAIPKYPLLPAIEVIPSHTPSHTAHHSLGKLEDHVSTDHVQYAGPGSFPVELFSSESEGTTSSQDSIGVFLTQVVTDEEGSNYPTSENATAGQKKAQVSPRSEVDAWSATDAYHARLKELRERYQDVAVKYKGYEVLLDEKDTDYNGDTIPSDLLGCSRALQYALWHPLILSNYHFRPNTHTSIRKLPTPRPGTSDGSGTSRPHLNQVLDDMKSHSVTVEASVAEVLALADHKGTTQLRKECRKLLAELQKHYDQVRTGTLETHSHHTD